MIQHRSDLVRFTLAVPLLLAASGCVGCLETGYDDPSHLMCKFLSFTAKSEQVAETPLQEGMASDELDPVGDLQIHPGDAFSFPVQFKGGPIDRVWVDFGFCSFEIPIDLSRANDEVKTGVGADAADNAEILLAKDANQPEGVLKVEARLPSMPLYNHADEGYYSTYFRGTDGVMHYGVQVKYILCRADGRCDNDSPTADPSGAGSGGTGGTVGGGGGTTDGATWKDTWRFVQSDKAVQYRLGLVRKDGTQIHFKVQYRVNSTDDIYCANCGGYHTYGNINADYYRVEFPSSFVLPQIYELSQEFVVDVQPPATFDEQQMQIDLTNGFLLPYSCADDNSAASRCSTWDAKVTLGRFTATNNAGP